MIYLCFIAQHTSLACGHTTCSRGLSFHEAASVGLGQSSADDGTALVVDNDQQAIRVRHLKPKRVDAAQSFIEQFGVNKEEYDAHILCGR